LIYQNIINSQQQFNEKYQCRRTYNMRKALPAFRGTFRCTKNKDMLGENNKMIKQAFRPVNFSFISVAEICFVVKTLRNIK
jgi:hypothetical protein